MTTRLRLVATVAAFAACGDSDPAGGGGQGGEGGSSSTVGPCEGELLSCDGACVDPILDDTHCGACPIVCQAGTLCFAGACTGPAPLPRSRAGHAAVAGPDGRIYVVGGHDHAQLVPEVSVFDPRTNAWTELEPLPEPRTYLGAAWHGVGEDGRLLAIGGGILTGAPNLAYEAQVLVHAYDPIEKGWSAVGPLPTARADYTVAVSGESIFALMGNSSSVPDVALDTMDVLERGEWMPRDLPPGMLARGGAKAATGLDGKIFVCGGAPPDEPPTNVVDIFDPGTGMVTPGPPLQIAAVFGAAASDAEGRIYYVGGAGAAAQRLVPGEEAWDRIADLPEDRADTAAALGSDGRVYVIGGFVDGQPRNSTDTVFVYDDVHDLWVF